MSAFLQLTQHDAMMALVFYSPESLEEKDVDEIIKAYKLLVNAYLLYGRHVLRLRQMLNCPIPPCFRTEAFRIEDAHNYSKEQLIQYYVGLMDIHQKVLIEVLGLRKLRNLNPPENDIQLNGIPLRITLEDVKTQLKKIKAIEKLFEATEILDKRWNRKTKNWEYKLKFRYYPSTDQDWVDWDGMAILRKFHPQWIRDFDDQWALKHPEAVAQATADLENSV